MARILVVEDDADIRETLREVLTDHGYVVTTACNGREALDALDQITEPSAILLDLMMPVMTGPEFLEELDHRNPPSHSPIVIVSALPTTTARIEPSKILRTSPKGTDHTLPRTRTQKVV